MVRYTVLLRDDVAGARSGQISRLGALCAATLWCALGCGVPKDFVNQESVTAFHNTVDAAAHVKAKCGDQADTDTDCKQSLTKLGQLCAGLDELAKKAGGSGFDCAAWKERS
jgi:hypothetical protein